MSMALQLIGLNYSWKSVKFDISAMCAVKLLPVLNIFALFVAVY